MQRLDMAQHGDQDLVQRIEQATPAQLHGMLLGAGEKFLNLAILAINTQDASAKSRHLGRVADIVVELSSRLNLDQGGDLACNLKRIYDGWIDILFDAGQKNQSDRLFRVLDQMGQMRASWEECDLNPVGMGKAV